MNEKFDPNKQWGQFTMWTDLPLDAKKFGMEMARKFLPAGTTFEVFVHPNHSFFDEEGNLVYTADVIGWKYTPGVKGPYIA